MWLTLHAAKSTAPSDKGAIITEQDLFIRQGHGIANVNQTQEKKSIINKI